MKNYMHNPPPGAYWAYSHKKFPTVKYLLFITKSLDVTYYIRATSATLCNYSAEAKGIYFLEKIFLNEIPSLRMQIKNAKATEELRQVNIKKVDAHIAATTSMENSNERPT